MGPVGIQCDQCGKRRFDSIYLYLHVDRRRIMATNWPPTPGTYPAWPPVEIPTTWLSFSSIQVAIDILQEYGFTRANPTAAENNAFFKQVRCDDGHPASGIMIVSPGGLRYPFAYCTGATHKSALVLWVVGISHVDGSNCYDLGWGSGVIT